MRTMRAWLMVGLIGTLAGCEYRQDFVSQTDGGVDAAALVSRDATVVWLDSGLPYRACSPAPRVAGTATPIEAAWEGYLERPLPSGADGVRIVLRSSDSGDLSGTVVHGTAPAPESPSASDECYPPEASWDGRIAAAALQHPVEGFEYPITAASWSAIRLQVAVLTWAPWADWCSCQVPVAASPEGGLSCHPNVGGGDTPDGHCFMNSFEGGTSVEFPCCRQVLCLDFSACLCNSEACAVSTTATTIFDLTVDDERADGTMSGSTVYSAVHLLRTQ